MVLHRIKSLSVVSNHIPGVQTLPGEKKTRFEDWLSKNHSFRFHAQGNAPELDMKKARTELFKKIGEKEISGTQGNTTQRSGK